MIKLKHEKTSAAYIVAWDHALFLLSLLSGYLYWYSCDTSSRLHSLGTADQIPTWRLYLSLERWIQTTMLNNSMMKPTVKVNQKRYIVIPVYCDTFSNFT